MPYDENDAFLKFRIPSSLKLAIRGRADALGINVSELLRNCIRDELDKGRITHVNPQLKGTPKDNTKLVSFFCPADIADKFTETCKKQNLPKSLVLRQFLSDYVDTYNSDNH